ncbi:aminoglycoside phosphotransferase family protein [Streptomyces sp. NPDC049879]|uniref:aminoglycoside phosphotransferase family protein n=1 Tax=Streptomyces sp. NPDC049879 TaxID=3365598 RepID=UPI00378ACE5E
MSGPRWADLPVAAVASTGTDNAMFRLGDDLAVRLPRIPGAVGNVTAEQHWLPRLAPHLPFAVPAPVGLGAPGEGFPWPWSVLRWLDGANPAVGRLAEPAALAAGLGRFVSALRDVPAGGGPAAGRGVPLARRDADTRAAIGELRALAAAGTPEGRDGRPFDLDAVTAAWDDALRAPAYTGPPVWVHGDLSPGNVLTGQDGRLTAVIDFGCLGTGAPDIDLMPAWNLLPAAARPALRAALGADDAAWARGRGWALSVALLQLPYYRETNPGLAASARHVIGEVLADVSRAAAAPRASARRRPSA